MSAFTLKDSTGSNILDVSDAGVVTAPSFVGAVTGNVTGNASGTAGALASGSTFTSTEQTGTGSSQNVAHGLGAVPRIVWWSLSELPADLAAGADVAPGTHTSTNAVFTVTSGVKFFVFAIK
jgi:hypothetical protein